MRQDPATVTMKDRIKVDSANVKYVTKKFELKRQHKTDAGHDIRSCAIVSIGTNL